MLILNKYVSSSLVLPIKSYEPELYRHFYFDVRYINFNTSGQFFALINFKFPKNQYQNIQSKGIFHNVFKIFNEIQKTYIIWMNINKILIWNYSGSG